jgi:hypothetical protein
MERFHRLAHSVWDFKYHIVWIPKYRRKKLYGKKRRIVVETIKQWARIKGIEIIEGHAPRCHSVPRLILLLCRNIRCIHQKRCGKEKNGYAERGFCRLFLHEFPSFCELPETLKDMEKALNTDNAVFRKFIKGIFEWNPLAT